MWEGPTVAWEVYYRKKGSDEHTGVCHVTLKAYRRDLGP